MSEIFKHYLEIMTDPAHVLVEFTFVLIDYLIIRFIVEVLLKKRDRAHGHNKEH